MATMGTETYNGETVWALNDTISSTESLNRTITFETSSRATD